MDTRDVPVGIGVPTLQVIGPGFGRTGTLSMRTALERLGFGPCDHMVENEAHPERFALWERPCVARRLASRSTGGRC
jgi:sulfotransferase family protein